MIKISLHASKNEDDLGCMFVTLDSYLGITRKDFAFSSRLMFMYFGNEGAADYDKEYRID